MVSIERNLNKEYYNGIRDLLRRLAMKNLSPAIINIIIWIPLIILLIIGLLVPQITNSAFGTSLGWLSAGLFSMGVLSAGLFSVGVYSAGLFAVGVFSAGVYSVGVFAFGTYAIGIWASGQHVYGIFTSQLE
jgi:hypothetical protein